MAVWRIIIWPAPPRPTGQSENGRERKECDAQPVTWHTHRCVFFPSYGCFVYTASAGAASDKTHSSEGHLTGSSSLTTQLRLLCFYILTISQSPSVSFFPCFSTDQGSSWEMRLMRNVIFCFSCWLSVTSDLHQCALFQALSPPHSHVTSVFQQPSNNLWTCAGQQQQFYMQRSNATPRAVAPSSGRLVELHQSNLLKNPHLKQFLKYSRRRISRLVLAVWLNDDTHCHFFGEAVCKISQCQITSFFMVWTVWHRSSSAGRV